MAKIGIVCSSAGGAFYTAQALLASCGLHHNYFVVTDRQCGIEEKCFELSIPVRRIIDADKSSFSKKASYWLFEEMQVDWVCLFFSRIIGAELFERGLCVNIHPSLLPEFPGMGAVRKALEHRSNFLGCTAHIVDVTVDGGPIIAQTCAQILQDISFDAAQKLSFAQKVYLFLLLAERSSSDQMVASFIDSGSKAANHTNSYNLDLINASLKKAFKRFLVNEGVNFCQ